ncbi:hypothetical protein MTBLM5_320012 [Magnetospirillum sp. LM-5]|nr:hypothetical protein MTBLM5_320012 [Magnetospirillum sp. LM-5]
MSAGVWGAVSTMSQGSGVGLLISWQRLWHGGKLGDGNLKLAGSNPAPESKVSVFSPDTLVDVWRGAARLVVSLFPQLR